MSTKKLLSVTATIFMLATLSACNRGNDANRTTPAADTTAATATTSTAYPDGAGNPNQQANTTSTQASG